MADAATLSSCAVEFCSARRCGEAIAFWEQASTLGPANPDIHFQLGYCYAGDCCVHSLLDSEIAVFHYRRALALSRPENAVGRAMILGALGNAYVSASRGDKPKLLNAIQCYEAAVEIYGETGRPNDWAREQFNLGNAWCEMAEDTYPEKWSRAITHYERALTIRTRGADESRYAATLQNLGTAYRELRTGDVSSNIRKAIQCYHRAMQASRGAERSRKHADLHHNLGNAYLTLAEAEPDSVRNCRRAIRHLTRALALRPREESLFNFATAQFGCGQAYLKLAARGVRVTGNIDQARISFVAAIEAFLQSGHIELAREVVNLLENLPERAG
jgi:tetratricopeptide (TPR) repeat protein